MSGVAKNAAGHVEGYEIFIKYLPSSTTEDSIAKFFSEAGPMVGTPRLLKTADGGCKGAGWITFSTREAMDQAITWNGCRLDGRSLQISAAKAAHTGIRPSYQAAGTHSALTPRCQRPEPRRALYQLHTQSSRPCLPQRRRCSRR